MTVKSLINKAVFLVLALLSFSAFSNTSDSKINFEELEFHSEIEKELYMELIQTNKVSFDFLLMSNYEIDAEKRKQYKSKLKASIKKIKAHQAFKKEPKKQIKYILSAINSEYLEVAVKNSFFNDIFELNEYNSHTASMFYAYIFQQLDIPYKIKYSKNRVFIIAYPNTNPIRVIAPNTAIKRETFGPLDISKYVKLLLEAKIISKSELNLKTEKKIFDEHYLKTEEASLEMLAGLQYYTIAQSELLITNYKKAYQNLLKCYYITKPEMIEYQLYICIANIFETIDFSDPQKLELLSRLYAFKKYGLSNEFFVNIYQNYSQQVVQGKIDADIYTNQSMKLFKFLPDSLTSILEPEFYLSRAFNYYEKENYKKSFDDAQKLVYQDNNNLNAKKIMMSSIEKMKTSEDVILSLFEDMFSKEPRLKKDEIISDTYIAIHINRIQDLFTSDEIKKAEEALAKFETFFTFEDINPKLKPKLAEIFESIAQGYYYRRQLKKALIMIEKGLILDPNNYNLQKKKSALK